MKKLLLGSAFLLSACSQNINWNKVMDNPLTILTGGKTLNHVVQWGYKNTYLNQLKGVHISKIAERGLITSYNLAESDNLYEIYSTYIGWGSGETTNTYAVYADGSRQLLHSHYDGGANYFSIWLETDKDGIIIGYLEEGNDAHEMPAEIRAKLADLLGEDKNSPAKMMLVLNKESGNFGLAVGDIRDDIEQLSIKAFASCISKDHKIAINQLKTIEEMDKLNQKNNNGCKLANIPPPSALSLFKNQLKKGGYEFYGAVGENEVPDSVFQKEKNDCLNEGIDCELIGTFNQKDKGKIF